MMTAKRTGLDPMARQLFCVKRYDSRAKKEVMSVQVSIDGFRAIADRTNRYVPSREPTYTFDENKKLESATAYIKKFVAGSWHEITATAFYDEYVQTTREGVPNSMWKKMPRLMLAKCAESLVLRKAFPAELSGLYTPDEMGANTDAETGEIIHEPSNLHQIPPPPAQPEPLNKQLAELCADLNVAFETKQWTKNELTEHARIFFKDNSIESYTKLNDGKKARVN